MYSYLLLVLLLDTTLAMKVFVSGAGGQTGQACFRKMLARPEFTPRGIVRSEESRQSLIDSIHDRMDEEFEQQQRERWAAAEENLRQEQQKRTEADAAAAALAAYSENLEDEGAGALAGGKAKAAKPASIPEAADK